MLTGPGSSEWTALNYIYFVENEPFQDSRFKRCEILPDNSTSCTTVFDLSSH